jgi:hypothetical protein
MDTEQRGSRAAQPAEEEIKKHGDPLKKHVADQAGKQMQGREPQDARDDKAGKGNRDEA